jgi:hypothetical protein
LQELFLNANALGGVARVRERLDELIRNPELVDVTIDAFLSVAGARAGASRQLSECVISFSAGLERFNAKVDAAVDAAVPGSALFWLPRRVAERARAAAGGVGS